MLLCQAQLNLSWKVNECKPLPYGPRENYTGMINSLPMVQTPEAFGLHPNADISYYTNATKDIWADLIDLQPRVAGATGGISREDFIANVAKDIMVKIPVAFDMQIIKKEVGAHTG